MRLRARLLRIFRVTAIALVSSVLLLFAFVQGEQHLLRHRATHLLADYKTLQLGRTSWPEVQSFMHRWQHWGYASQPCNSAYCSFHISIDDTVSIHSPNWFERREGWLIKSHLQWVLDRLGYRAEGMYATVTVVNGALLGDSIGADLVIPRSGREEEYLVDMSIRSQPNLSDEQQTKGDYDAQIIDHPDYLVGRPGSCEYCYVGWIHFVPSVSDAEYIRMTDFQLACFTRTKSCTRPEDLLPMVAPFHLYDREARQAGFSSKIPACNESPYVLGRDAYWVLVLDALAVTPHKFGEEAKSHGYAYAAEDVKVSWVSVLKGGGAPRVEAIDTFMPFPGSQEGDASELPEHLVPGKRYIIFWNNPTVLDGAGALERCGFVPDTPENRAAVLAGITQNLKFQSSKLVFTPE